ncbi:estradiol 17-beta-dehydrogenase 8-like [Haliotis rubra]|uniref:estradiol 17-beta-dehydrogenase 8-like n=1 Tax=Haliotis rubra TaxID=36100 RepID=UPI001EE62B6E|nr:estradiol 17-beta-dehydrogenase 8-like [Haliotis rubra]
MASGVLAGRLAIVTGGGSGIGKAICQVFAREGAILAVVDIDKSNAEATVSGLPQGNQKHQAFTADIASSADVNAMMAQIKNQFSVLPSVAVNSAGITRDNFLMKMDEKNFDKVIDVNLKVGRCMMEGKVDNGSIINISSIVGKMGNIGQGNYAASKAGVVGLTKSAAREFARFNIRVNAVLPGFINTPMTAAVPEHLLQRAMFLVPMMKMGKSEDVADACVFLASDRSKYITGTSLEVAGGLGI